LSASSTIAVVSSAVGVCLLLIGMAFFMRGRWARNLIPQDKAEKVFKVIQKHTPGYIDEIQLSLGDVVIVKEQFDDGWGFGLNITTESQGSFPLICLSVLNENLDIETEGIKPSRDSSLASGSARSPLSTSPITHSILMCDSQKDLPRT
jgi:hypothetical protein